MKQTGTLQKGEFCNVPFCVLQRAFPTLGDVCARRAGVLRGQRPISFRRKETGERKGGEGNFSFPSPLPSKRAAFLWGRPIFWQWLTVFAVTCLAWQYNAFLIGGKLGSNGTGLAQSHRRGNLARLRIGGSAEGAAPPLRFLSHRFLWQRKRCSRRAGGPCGEHTFRR